MNAAYDRKVYDSDLAMPGRFHLLQQIAETYCREYVGNFEMMINAKWHLDVNGKLADGMYRSVLNTLRTDPLRTDLWRAVQALLFDPGREQADDVVVPFRRPPHREYGGHVAPKLRQKATFLQVRVTWKVPFQTALRPVHAPVVHLMWREVEGRWWRPRGANHDLLMDRPLEVFEVRLRTYCKSYGVHGSYFFERPTYEDAFPGSYEPSDVLMPFCRSCVRLYDERPELAVYEGDVE